MGRLRLLLVIVALFVIACENEELYNKGSEQVLSSFANSCQSSYGPWTKSALSHTQNLINSLESIKQHKIEDCKGVDNALQTVQNIHSQLQRMSEDYHVTNYRLAQEKRINLILSLTKAQQKNDQQLISYLRSALYEVELEIATAKAEASVLKSDTNEHRLIRGLDQLTNYVSSLASQGNLASCVASSPLAPLQIGSSLLAIGGNFATPVIGSALASIGQMINSSVMFLRTLPLEKAKLKFEDTRMQVALTCAIESMAQNYCEAKDAEELIEFALNDSSQDIQSPIWKSLNLLKDNLPILNRWLLKLSNGINPSDSFAAERLNKVWTNHNNLRLIKNSALGFLNEVQKKLNRTTDPADKTLIEKQGMKELLDHLLLTKERYSAATGPIADAYSRETIVCLLSQDPLCQDYIDQNLGYTQIIDKVIILNGFNGMKQRTVEIINNVSKIITAELQDTINQDPDLLITTAFQKGPFKVSPVRALSEISIFLKELKKDSHFRDYRQKRLYKLLKDTQHLTQKVLESLNDPKVPSIEALNIVFNDFKLLNGVQYYNSRVRQIIEWYLDVKIRKGDFPKNITTDLLASGKNISQQLNESGIDIYENADEILGDIRTAKHIAKQNLINTHNAFASTYDQAIKELTRTANDSGEQYFDEPSLQLLSKLCNLILITSNKWPQKVDIAYCEHSELRSVYKNSNLKLKFSNLQQTIKNQKYSFDKKVCIYSDFLKASKAFTKKDHSIYLLNKRQNLEFNKSWLPYPFL